MNLDITYTHVEIYIEAIRIVSISFFYLNLQSTACNLTQLS